MDRRPGRPAPRRAWHSRWLTNRCSTKQVPIMNERAETRPYFFRGVLAGALGGLAGTWAMNHAQRFWTRAVDQDTPESAGGKHDARDWQERSEGQNSNELAAQAVGRRAIGRPLTRPELRVAAPLVHYSFGTAVGALYGAYAERQRRPRLLQGVGFGTTLWLVADEVVMPAIGL